MNKYRYGGRCAAIAAAAIMLALAAAPAQAQRGGSFARTCTNIQAFGDRIIADCRTMDGAWNRTALHDIDSCVGDIGNMNGHLTCNHAQPNFRAYRERGWEGYGSSQGYGPGPYNNYGR
jgi:hypothetical protein